MYRGQPPRLSRDLLIRTHARGIEGLHAFMRASIVRVQVHVDRIDIMLDQDRVCRCLDETAKQIDPIDKTRREANRQVTTVSIPARLKRTGKEMRIIVDDGSESATPDAGLMRLLVRANAIRDQLVADRSLTFEDIAKSKGIVPSYATRLFRLTLLVPDIVSAILTGKHPPELTARRLMDDHGYHLIGANNGAVWDLDQPIESRRKRDNHRLAKSQTPVEPRPHFER